MYKRPKKEEAPIVIKHKVSKGDTSVPPIDITVKQKEEPIRRYFDTIVQQE